MNTTTERTLSNVAEEALHRRLEANREKVVQQLNKIEFEATHLNDFVVQSGKLTFSNDANVFSVGIPVGNTTKGMLLKSHALGQFGERYKIPTRFLNDLHEGSVWQRNLLAKVCNDYSKNVSKGFLLREVDGFARAFCSQNYKRLDTKMILTSFLEQVQHSKCVVSDAFASDIRCYVEVLYPTLIEIPTENNGIVGVAFGMQFSTSDYGSGALDIKGFVIQGVCFNGMTVETRIREIHLGGKLPENISFSQDTYRKESIAMSSAVRDMTSIMLKTETIENYGRMIQDASATMVDLEKEVKLLPKVGMQKGEVEMLVTKLANSKHEDGLQGEGSLWKLCQGVSAVARDAEDDSRKRELMNISGKLFERVNKNDK